ncbi:MAG: PIN domain-containing protein [Candidatus Dormibacteraeota bacterium]|nr:PIN domain-containing protein [Candidatus Dormibacteraeota bacterium]
MTATAAPQAVVDTDVVVDHLRGHRRLTADGVFAYSTVTRCELFAGTDEVATVRAVLDALVEVSVDRDVAERAGAIRRDHGLTVPDAIVAATALGCGVPLVTRNTRHFRAVTGLVVRAPS